MNSDNSSLQQKKVPGYPPPHKKPERRLSLKAAMALATKAPGHESLMPLVRKNDETITGDDDSRKKVEAYLLDLQADIINREELLEQKEQRLTARENDLNKRAGTLDEKVSEIEPNIDETQVSELAPKQKKEDLFKETREMLIQREKYIEECENELVKQLTQLTQREAEIEQREEQLDYKTKKLL